MAIVKQLGAIKSPVTWGRALGMDGIYKLRNDFFNLSREGKLVISLNWFIDILSPALIAFFVELDSGMKFNYIPMLQIKTVKLFCQIKPDMITNRFAILSNNIQ